MPLNPLAVEAFGGLNLRDDPSEIGWTAATDLLNVDFDRRGRVRTRDGTTQWNNSTLSSSGYSALAGSSALNGLYAVRYSSGGNVNIDQLTTAGVISAPVGSVPAGAGTFLLSHTDWGVSVPFAVATFATQPSTGVTYVLMIGGTISNGAGKPIFAAALPTSNRLVLGGFFAAADSPTGANGSRSTVFFSDVASNSFGANNWVTLRPADGEVITGMTVFGNELYVFKQSSAFVFYGESLSADGTPIFNYRRIDLPDPLVDPVLNAPNVPYVVTGPDGVYYSTAKGIWRTNGGPPRMLSTAVSKIFSMDPTISSGVQNAASSTPPSLAWVAARLVATYTSAAGSLRQLVWDPTTAMWTLWDVPGVSFAQYTANVGTARDALYYVRGSGNNNVFVMRPASTDDSGAAISWSYTSGYQAPANGQRVKVRGSSVFGTGTVTLQLLTQGGRTNDVVDPGGTVTLGSGTTVAEGKRRRSARGALFAHKLSGTGPATISRLTHRFLPPEPDA
jgi:hypothetical protein